VIFARAFAKDKITDKMTEKITEKIPIKTENLDEKTENIKKMEEKIQNLFESPKPEPIPTPVFSTSRTIKFYAEKDGNEPLLSDAAMKKSIHINITRNASAKNYLKYCKKLKTKYPNVINPRPSGHIEIRIYNFKDHLIHPTLQPSELRIQPRFLKNQKPQIVSQNPPPESGDPGAPFWPKEARYDEDDKESESKNSSIFTNEEFQRIKTIINDRNRIASGGSKRGRLEDSLPDTKKRKMSNGDIDSTSRP